MRPLGTRMFVDQSIGGRAESLLDFSGRSCGQWSVRDGNADDCDLEFVRSLDHLDSIEHDDISRSDRKARTSILREVLDGLESNGGDIGTTVVLGARAFRECPSAFLAEFTGAFDHAVGAFDGFDGDDIEIADAQRLSDVETQEFGEHGPDEIDVRLLSGGGLGERHHAGLRELGLDGDGRVDERHSFAIKFLGDRTQHGMRSPVVSELGQHYFNSSQIGDIFEQSPAGVHDLRFIDMSDHDRVLDASGSEFASPGSQSEQSNFFKGVAQSWECGVVASMDPDAMDWVSHVAETFRDEDGESAASGDESDGCGSGWGIGQDGKNAGHWCLDSTSILREMQIMVLGWGFLDWSSQDDAMSGTIVWV